MTTLKTFTALNLDARPTSLAQAFDQYWHASGVASLPALTDGTRTLTYAELAEATDAVATGLLSRDASPGDVVAILMDRSLDAVVLLLASIRAGLCPCIFEPGLASGEVSARLVETRARFLVHDAENTAFVESLSTRYVVTVLSFACLTEPWYFSTINVTADCPALLLFTSGSTGRPKVVQLTQAALVNNALGVVEQSMLSTDDRLLHVMPIYHTNGVNNQLFAPLLSGSLVAFCSRFRAEDMPDLMARFKPTVITGVPTMYSRMLAQHFDADTLSTLRMARCGSAPITEALHREVEAKLGCPLVISYGLSEATCTSTLNPPAARRIGSVGKVLSGQTVGLRTVDGTISDTPGVEGEICISGPNLMNKYLGADDATARTVIDGWLRTGDLGRFDDDGYLYVTGRIKDVIIRGGENLSPLLIESVIVAEEDVISCCVVGRAEKDLGEVPVAFVVSKNPGTTSVQQVQDAVKRRLSRIYVPHEVLFVDSLPETAVGKIDRKTLSARLASGFYDGKQAAL
ncbi:acyl-CoA synthetase (AMP-forming)/AMP-acid ligase II [Paraburkholderia sp. BL6665CI2N2]|uniref:class I adenylate-forming enzyme family protein n=1 Tax=Paraburkholderia sp. BL6665CI2N2 TaxID=1938806 RepID=UPI0010652F53|nr:class I adenylate-forming enzyme family protein [Paraburkholderia sp. BL6665CI2N2]TDY21942.1 acyl-CoA synthetase (AMP-forming)/AMP-acid ligase II [Paraburkholderia sp. BL6665CI2N2]